MDTQRIWIRTSDSHRHRGRFRRPNTRRRLTTGAVILILLRKLRCSQSILASMLTISRTIVQDYGLFLGLSMSKPSILIVPVAMLILFSGFAPAPRTIYFNRPDVKRAIHAPLDKNWTACASTPSKPQSVFQGPNHNQTGEDQSLPPAQTDVLKRVIEHTNNVIIGSGGLDFLVPTNGTLLVLQNTTWNGKQGFELYPDNEFFVPSLPIYNLGSEAGSGLLGTWGTERGLTFYEVHLAGHEIPEYASGGAFRVMELLLGKIDTLDDRGRFTTMDVNGTALERRTRLEPMCNLERQ